MAVYVAMCKISGLVKIGTSENVPKRIKDVARQSGAELVLLRTMDGSYLEEGWMHMRFCDQNAHGEWFHFDAKMLSEVVPDTAMQELQEHRKRKNIALSLSEDEKKELQEAAARSASPVATWARSVLIREARKGGAE